MGAKNSLSSLRFVRDLAGRSGVGCDCSGRRSILDCRGRTLLTLFNKFLLRPEPAVFWIAGAALTLPDLVSPLPDCLVAAAAADNVSDMIGFLARSIGSMIRPRSGSFSCVGLQTHGAAQFQNDPQPTPDDLAAVHVRRHTVFTWRPAGTGWL